jgi:hypothetical protein
VNAYNIHTPRAAVEVKAEEYLSALAVLALVGPSRLYHLHVPSLAWLGESRASGNKGAQVFLLLACVHLGHAQAFGILPEVPESWALGEVLPVARVGVLSISGMAQGLGP